MRTIRVALVLLMVLSFLAAGVPMAVYAEEVSPYSEKILDSGIDTLSLADKAGLSLEKVKADLGSVSSALDPDSVSIIFSNSFNIYGEDLIASAPDSGSEENAMNNNQPAATYSMPELSSPEKPVTDLTGTMPIISKSRATLTNVKRPFVQILFPLE